LVVGLAVFMTVYTTMRDRTRVEVAKAVRDGETELYDAAASRFSEIYGLLKDH